jgi:hypothetical protein
MKKFVYAVSFCFLLFLFGLFIFSPNSTAQSNVLQNLLDLPAPAPPNPLNEKRNTGRYRVFSSKDKPSDDAPIEVLLDYWALNANNRSSVTYSEKPSERVLDRIIEEIEKNPDELLRQLGNFPHNSKYSDLVKRLYDQDLVDQKNEPDWRSSLKDWLTNNSSYFSDDLLTKAQAIKETTEYVTDQESLIALAKVDWEKARPIVERLLNDSSKPVSQTLARWVAYQHAIDAGNLIDADRYRKALQETVENKNALPGNRDLAMDALVHGGDFNGRDDWYFSLLDDESLHDLRVNGTTYTGLTTILRLSPPDKYKAKMIELVRNGSKKIRGIAAKNLFVLITQGDVEVVKALLPMLENPDWVDDAAGPRQLLVEQLNYLEIPESVTGLLAVLNEKATRKEVVYTPVAANVAMANRAVISRETVISDGSGSSNDGGKTIEIEYYPFRASAIGALGKQKSVIAIGALRNVLPEVEPYERRNVIAAILECGGFSVTEQVQGLEVIAKQNAKMQQSYGTNAANYASNSAGVAVNVAVDAAKDAAANAMPNSYATNSYSNPKQPFNFNDLPALLGLQLADERDACDELVKATIDRIKVLESKSPAVATIMRSFVKNWRGKAVNSLLLQDLSSGSTDVTSVIKLLSLRKELREKQSDEIFETRRGSAIAAGISACLLEDNNEYEALLNADNNDAKTAMLSCAKLLRSKLPIKKVAENLKNADKMLALAAERYLETEDSPEARQIVLSLHPNEAKILGAKTAFFFSNGFNENLSILAQLFETVQDSGSQFSSAYIPNYREIEESEEKLQKEVKENVQLKGIYSYQNHTVRIYQERAIYSWQEDKARYRERELTKEEFSNLTSYLSYSNVDELPPFISFCDYCDADELLMIGRNGGRRVFVHSERKPKFFAELSKILEDFRIPPSKLHYHLEKHISGLEVLFDENKLQAVTVWKTGKEIQLLTEDGNRRKQVDNDIKVQEEREDLRIDGEVTEEVIQKREVERIKNRRKHFFDEFAWFKFENGKLVNPIAQPADVEFVPKNRNLHPANENLWKARFGKVEITIDENALYKNVNGNSTKIKSGDYVNPIISDNGAWVLVTKQVEYEPTLVRINLATNKEYKLKIPADGQSIRGEVFIPAINKMLVFIGYYYEHDHESEGEKEGKYYLLDMETGIFQPAKEDIEPLAQQTFRRLQPTTNLNEFWAAKQGDRYTEIGRYDSKLLKFNPIIKLPEIEFDSMDMYVDETEQKIYIVYNGQLLRIPLPQKR